MSVWILHENDLLAEAAVSFLGMTNVLMLDGLKERSFWNEETAATLAVGVSLVEDGKRLALSTAVADEAAIAMLDRRSGEIILDSYESLMIER